MSHRRQWTSSQILLIAPRCENSVGSGPVRQILLLTPRRESPSAVDRWPSTVQPRPQSTIGRLQFDKLPPLVTVGCGPSTVVCPTFPHSVNGRLIFYKFLQPLVHFPQGVQDGFPGGIAMAFMGKVNQPGGSPVPF